MAAAESTVWTWGRAKNFRLGRAFVGTDARVPEKVSGFEGVAVRHAACGGGHTAVVLEDDRLFVFGYSQYGQLGLGDRNDMCDATQVFLIAPADAAPLPAGATPAATAAASTAAAAAAAAAARVRRPGAPGAAGGSSLPVAEVACGRYHTIARTQCGLVYTWGGGKNGRLGHGDEKIRAQPTCVHSLSGQRATRITAGYHNNLVLTTSGEVWSWGWGAHGQLGLGDTHDRDVPTVIPELSRERVKLLSCGDRHSFAIAHDGRVLGWGSNEFGQLGCGKKGDVVLRPTLIEGLCGLMIVAISSGDRHSAAVTNTGAVYTWGCGTDGQCGHGNLHDVARPKLVENLVGKFVVDVKCGHNFTMVVSSAKEVFAWGNNTYGQLGNNGNGKSDSSVKVVMNAGAKMRNMSCAHFHCIMWMDVSERGATATTAAAAATAAAGGAETGKVKSGRRVGIAKGAVALATAAGGSADEGAGVGPGGAPSGVDVIAQVEEARERLAHLLEVYAAKRVECRDAVDRERDGDKVQYDSVVIGNDLHRVSPAH